METPPGTTSPPEDQRIIGGNWFIVMGSVVVLGFVVAASYLFQRSLDPSRSRVPRPPPTVDAPLPPARGSEPN